MSYYISESTFKEIYEFILSNQDEIHSILGKIATYKSIQEEINAAIRTIKSANSELKKYQPPLIEKSAVYFPSNALLYSYVLYVIIPSAYTKKIAIRPSKITSAYLSKIHSFFCNHFVLFAQLKLLSQIEFKEETRDSDLVIFTGQYENSLKVAEHYPDSIFIFFGSGYNPVVFSSHCCPNKAVKITLESRLLNSGQDCFMSDIFFIHESICQSYVKNLIEEIKLLRYGTASDSDYGPIYYENIFSRAKKYLHQYAKYLIYQGEMEESLGKLPPIVFLSSITDMIQPTEFFSPVFNIVTYKEIEDVKSWLLREDQLENAMGISVYGDYQWVFELYGKYNVFIEKSVLESENGNEPFGGYGIKANYVKFDNHFVRGPILISKALSEAKSKLATQ